MPDEFNSLVREVERLVTAPYVPSLQVSLLSPNTAARQN